MYSTSAPVLPENIGPTNAVNMPAIIRDYYIEKAANLLRFAAVLAGPLRLTDCDCRFATGQLLMVCACKADFDGVDALGKDDLLG